MKFPFKAFFMVYAKEDNTISTPAEFEKFSVRSIEVHSIEQARYIYEKSYFRMWMAQPELSVIMPDKQKKVDIAV